MNKHLCYVAGPMSGCSWDTANDWRERVRVALSAKYKVLTPLRGKDLCREKDGFAAADQAAVPGYYDRDIVRRDIYDVSRADVVLVNYLGAERVSIGTVMEQARAFVQGKYVVLVMEPEGNLHDHCFVREHCCIQFYTLEEAVRYLKEVLNDH